MAKRVLDPSLTKQFDMQGALNYTQPGGAKTLIMIL